MNNKENPVLDNNVILKIKIGYGGGAVKDWGDLVKQFGDTALIADALRQILNGEEIKWLSSSNKELA